MKIKSKILKVSGAVIAMAFVFTSIAFAINSKTNTPNDNNTVPTNAIVTEIKPAKPQNTPAVKDGVAIKKEDNFIKQLAKKYGKSEAEIRNLKENSNNWNEVYEKLDKEKLDKKSLSEERVMELYEEGYGLQDIDKAEQLAAMTDKSVEEILKMKGKTTDCNLKELKKGRGEKTDGIYAKSWSEVEQEIGVDTRSTIEKLEVPEDIVSEMREKGLSEKEMGDIAVTAKNFNKDYRTVWEEYKNGKSVKEINDAYLSERYKNAKKPSIEETNKVEEKFAREHLKMTEEEIQKCKENGLEGGDIISAKTLADRYNCSLDKVIELKKIKKDWKEVSQELGGSEQ